MPQRALIRFAAARKVRSETTMPRAAMIKTHSAGVLPVSRMVDPVAVAAIIVSVPHSEFWCPELFGTSWTDGCFKE